MRFHGLGDSGAKAIAVALTVRAQRLINYSLNLTKQ